MLDQSNGGGNGGKLTDLGVKVELRVVGGAAPVVEECRAEILIPILPLTTCFGNWLGPFRKIDDPPFSRNSYGQ